MDFADFDNQWIEIFRAGDYGDKGKYTRADLQRVVANFNPGTHTPPAVIGHPKTDSPAFGWVDAVKVDPVRDVLLAKFKQVHKKLEKSVLKGRFPNRSAAFYLNPEGRGLTLRHVGFLGGTPPEVKGLAPIRFSDGAFIAIDFKEDDGVDTKQEKKLAKQMRKLRKFVKQAGTRLFGDQPTAGLKKYTVNHPLKYNGKVYKAGDPIQLTDQEVAASPDSFRYVGETDPEAERKKRTRGPFEFPGQDGKFLPSPEAGENFLEVLAELNSNPALMRRYAIIANQNPGMEFFEAMHQARGAITFASNGGATWAIDPNSEWIAAQMDSWIKDAKANGDTRPEWELMKEAYRALSQKLADNQAIVAQNLDLEQRIARGEIASNGGQLQAPVTTARRTDVQTGKDGYVVSRGSVQEPIDYGRPGTSAAAQLLGRRAQPVIDLTPRFAEAGSFRMLIHPASEIISQRAEARVREMRKEGRKEAEHILFREAMVEVRDEVFAEIGPY